MYFKKLLKTNLQSLNCFIEMINIKLLVKTKIQPDKNTQQTLPKNLAFSHSKNTKTKQPKTTKTHTASKSFSSQQFTF